MFANDYQRLLKVFADVSRAVHIGEDLTTTLQTILTHMKAAFSAKGCAIRSLDQSTGELKLLASAGLSSEYLAKGPVKSSSHISEIFENNPVVIEDVCNDPRVQYPEAVTAEGITSVLGFPFRIIGSHRMVLRLYFAGKTDVAESDLSFIQSLVEQCAIAIRYTLLQSRYLETFRNVSKAIHSGTNTGDILQSIVTHIVEIMEAKGCIFWIINTAEDIIETKVCHGFNYESLLNVDYQTLQHLFCPQENRYIFIDDARNDDRIPSLERLGKKRVTSIAGLPFQIVEPYIGILAVYFGTHRPLMQSEIDFLQALGEQGAISLHKALRYDEDMLATFRQTIEGLVLALEAKDTLTHGHSLRVADYAKRTAGALGLPAKQIETIYRAGLLHDIGKIGMGDTILERLGKLSAKEMNTVRRHPVIGAKIIAPLSFLGDVVPLIRHHHERFDGSGYPDGLKGEQIPFGARILAVCDAFETMTAGRPNMPRMTVIAAMERLSEASGILFDPQVVQAWLQVAKNNPETLSPPEAPTACLQKITDSDESFLKKNAMQANMWFRFPGGF